MQGRKNLSTSTIYQPSGSRKEVRKRIFATFAPNLRNMLARHTNNNEFSHTTSETNPSTSNSESGLQDTSTAQESLTLEDIDKTLADNGSDEDSSASDSESELEDTTSNNSPDEYTPLVSPLPSPPTSYDTTCWTVVKHTLSVLTHGIATAIFPWAMYAPGSFAVAIPWLLLTLAACYVGRVCCNVILAWQKQQNGPPWSRVGLAVTDPQNSTDWWWDLACTALINPDTLLAGVLGAAAVLALIVSTHLAPAIIVLGLSIRAVCHTILFFYHSVRGLHTLLHYYWDHSDREDAQDIMIHAGKTAGQHLLALLGCILFGTALTLVCAAVPGLGAIFSYLGSILGGIIPHCATIMTSLTGCLTSWVSTLPIWIKQGVCFAVTGVAVMIAGYSTYQLGQSETKIRKIHRTKQQIKKQQTTKQQNTKQQIEKNFAAIRQCIITLNDTFAGNPADEKLKISTPHALLSDKKHSLNLQGRNTLAFAIKKQLPFIISKIQQPIHTIQDQLQMLPTKQSSHYQVKLNLLVELCHTLEKAINKDADTILTLWKQLINVIPPIQQSSCCCAWFKKFFTSSYGNDGTKLADDEFQFDHFAP